MSHPRKRILAGVCVLGMLACTALSAQELYNPVPSALAVNSSLEKYKEDSRGGRKADRSIQAKYVDCRDYVAGRYAAGTESWHAGMRRCEETRQARLKAARQR